MTDDEPPREARTWFERNAILAALLLIGVPFLIRGALEGLGVSATVAELTQIVVGVAALAVVTVVILRARR